MMTFIRQASRQKNQKHVNISVSLLRTGESRQLIKFKAWKMGQIYSQTHNNLELDSKARIQGLSHNIEQDWSIGCVLSET